MASNPRSLLVQRLVVYACYGMYVYVYA